MQVAKEASTTLAFGVSSSMQIEKNIRLLSFSWIEIFLSNTWRQYICCHKRSDYGCEKYCAFCKRQYIQKPSFRLTLKAFVSYYTSCKHSWNGDIQKKHVINIKYLSILIHGLVDKAGKSSFFQLHTQILLPCT